MWRGDQVSLDRFEVLFAQPDLQMADLSAAAVELAAQLRANHEQYMPDAVHAACCL